MKMAEIGLHSGSSDEEDSDYVPDEEEIRKAEQEMLKNPIAVHSDSNKTESSVPPVVDDKAKAEKLWKNFLSDDVNVSSSENVNGNSSKALPNCNETSVGQDLPKNTDLDSTACLQSDTSEQNDGNSSINESEDNKTALPHSSSNLPKKRGLDSFLSKVQNKKPKMNTLQMSLMDWESFKKDEGISEDLQTFNKGKRGFLERQAFLSRSDLRSFEVEKSLRLSKKK